MGNFKHEKRNFWQRYVYDYRYYHAYRSESVIASNFFSVSIYFHEFGSLSRTSIALPHYATAFYGCDIFLHTKHLR